MSVSVDYESLQPGPTGRNIAVVDYDGKNGVYYDPVDLNHSSILARGGLEPSESDPHFHQQMVYAVTKETIEHFEAALGRPIHWRRDPARAGTARPPPGQNDNIWVLRVFPHAFPQANAFYSPSAHGILYGYFKAGASPGRNLPGQTVFTCLSHDIVVHETTHAIIDGMRANFMEGTNVDVAAFHEAFADCAALFRHFTHRDVLLDTIRRTGGLLFSEDLYADAPSSSAAEITAQIRQRNPLIDLARQFGDAIGRNAGLRQAIGTPPNDKDIHTKTEPHARGSILVAAIFDAYFSIYMRQTAIYFRLLRAGGHSSSEDVPEPLALILCNTAASLADLFFKALARAIDYCPPVDITFGDFLRGLITAHHDLDPVDDAGIRDAFMESFRLRGISADTALFYSEDALRWPAGSDLGLPPISNVFFGEAGRLLTLAEKNANGDALREYANQPAVRRALSLDSQAAVAVPSFHPMFHVATNGTLRVDMAVELVQTRRVPFCSSAPGLGEFPLRAGATLIIRQSSAERLAEVRYAIVKKSRGPDGDAREGRQRLFLQSAGLVEGAASDDQRFRLDFAHIHGGL